MGVCLSFVCSRPSGNGVVKHYHIKKTNDGQFFISDSHPFDTLPELVVYHKHESSGQCDVICDDDSDDCYYVTDIVILLLSDAL